MKIPLFEKKKKIITALEIGSGWLRIVQVESFVKSRKIKKIIVEKVAISRSSQNEKISEQIKDLLKGSKIDVSSLIVIVPHQAAAIRNLELPSTNPAEIKNMVELQIGKLTPFAKDEIIYDYQILNTNAEGYSGVMLAIVHQDIIRRYLDILKLAELKTERIALSFEGLLAWYRFAYKGGATVESQALVNLDCDKSDFTVISEDKVVFCRNISLGQFQDSNIEGEWQKKLTEEIKHSIYAYQSELAGSEIGKIIITGAQVFISSLNEASLKSEIGLPVEIIPQLENIPEASGSSAEDSGVIKNVSVAALLGFALTYPEQKFNFIPLQLRIEKEMRQREKDVYFVGTYLVFILMTISSIFLGRVYNKEQYLTLLKQETSKIQEKADELNSMRKVTEEIKKRTFRKAFALNFIYEIHSVVFPEIYLTAISFDGENQLTLRGVSSAMSEIFGFLNTLEKSKYFQNVKTKFVTTRNIEGKDLTEFEIICSLEDEFKLQPIGSK